MNHSKGRWHHRDALLVWMMPASYALHILEEWYGGFLEWVALVIGSPLPRESFIAINAVALALMLAATYAATRREVHGWMAIAIATVLLVNGLAHIAGTLLTRSYPPVSSPASCSTCPSRRWCCSGPGRRLRSAAAWRPALRCMGL